MPVRTRGRKRKRYNIGRVLVLIRPNSVYRLGKMPIQSCGQGVSALRGRAGARLNAHTELRTKRQRLVREAIYRNRLIQGECPYGRAAGKEEMQRRWCACSQ